MFFKIALKELKQLKRDKKSFIINIIFPLLMITVIAISTAFTYSKTSSENSKFMILTNSTYIQEILSVNENYTLGINDNVDDISSQVKKNKDSIGILWNDNTRTATFITNSDEIDKIKIVKDNILKSIQLDKLSVDEKVDISTDSIKVSTNYGPIALKITAAISAFLILLLSFRLNNTTTFYLTTNEKISGVLEAMLSAPIRAIDIILGKWIANFVSCMILTLTVLLPIYSGSVILFELFLGLRINLITKLPLIICEVILFCSIISIFQIFLGFVSQSTKQAQMFLAYSPLVLFVPLSVMFGIDIKNLSEYIFQSYIIDFIPMLNFYDLIQISILGIINIKKILIIFLINILFVLVILKKLINIFKSERILYFKN